MTASHASEATERQIAGCLVYAVGNRIADGILDRVRPDDFTTELPRLVVETANQIRDRGDTVDIATLAATIRQTTGRDRELDLDHLTADAAPATIESQCNEVARLARLRRRQRAVTALHAAAETGDEEAWQDATEHLAQLEAPDSLKARFHAPDRVADLLWQALNDADTVRWPWPLESLNRMAAGGARRGQLTFIGGASSVAKSAFVDQCLHSMAAAGANTLLALNEMTASERAERWAAMLANVDYGRLQRATAGVEQLPQVSVKRVFDTIPHQKVAMLEVAGWRVEHIIREARRRQVDVLAVDIIQKLPFRDGWSRPHVIEDAVQKLDAFAKSTGAHVLIVGQVNRARAQADGSFPIPSMTDVKDSAELVNGPDNVLLLWREQDRDTMEFLPEGLLRVAKYRGAALKTIPVLFEGRFQRWAEPVVQTMEVAA